jgi:hypothetical protein
MKRTALAETFILALLISAIAGIASSKATSANAESAVPTISIVYPTNETFFNVSIEGVFFDVLYETNEPLSWVGFSIDGGSNVTATGNSTDEQEWINSGYQFDGGYNTLTLYANDTAGNWATLQTVTYLVNFYPDSTPLPSSSSSTQTPTPVPNQVPTLTPTTNVTATTDSGVKVELSITGNVTSSQMSNVTITTNQSASTTTVSFTVTGESGATDFSNITIPKSVVSYGTIPIIYIDGALTSNQGFRQDSNNYYVWYTTSFSTHTISIIFGTNSLMPEFPTWIILPFFAIVILLSIIFVRKKSQFPK